MAAALQSSQNSKKFYTSDSILRTQKLKILARHTHTLRSLHEPIWFLRMAQINIVFISLTTDTKEYTWHALKSTTEWGDEVLRPFNTSYHRPSSSGGI